MLREKCNFQNCLSRTIEILVKNDINRYIGYVSAKVSDIKNITYNSYRLFYILDTATQDRVGHSDVHPFRDANIYDLSEKALKKAIRYEICQVFQEVHTNT